MNPTIQVPCMLLFLLLSGYCNFFATNLSKAFTPPGYSAFLAEISKRCAIDGQQTISAVAINDNSLKIRTTGTYFNCCSEEFWEEVSVEGNKIRVYMFEDDKEACDCVCPTSVEFVLDNLQLGQTYNIVLSKNLYGGYFSFEVVFERDTDLMFIKTF